MNTRDLVNRHIADEIQRKVNEDHMERAKSQATYLERQRCLKAVEDEPEIGGCVVGGEELSTIRELIDVIRRVKANITKRIEEDKKEGVD